AASRSVANCQQGTAYRRPQGSKCKRLAGSIRRLATIACCKVTRTVARHLSVGRRHQRLECRRNVVNACPRQHPINDVLLSRRRLELREALSLFEVPPDHRFWLLVRLRNLLHHRLDLFRSRLQALVAHELADNQSEGDAVLRSSTKHVDFELD